MGSIGVLYATLVGREPSSLQNDGEYLAIAIVVVMTLAALCGLSAWRADAAWACHSARYAANKGSRDDRQRWLNVRRWCDRAQVVSFGIGLVLAAWLTIGILHV